MERNYHRNFGKRLASKRYNVEFIRYFFVEMQFMFRLKSSFGNIALLLLPKRDFCFTF